MRLAVFINLRFMLHYAFISPLRCVISLQDMVVQSFHIVSIERDLCSRPDLREGSRQGRE